MFLIIVIVVFPLFLMGYFAYELFNDQPKLKIDKKGITYKGKNIHWDNIKEAVLIVETRKHGRRVYFINLINHENTTLKKMTVQSLDLVPEDILLIIQSYYLLYKKARISTNEI